MKDPEDTKTLELGALEQAVTHLGRPRVHVDAAARQRAYRDRKRAQKNARSDTTIPLFSSLIDLSVLPAWRRR